MNSLRKIIPAPILSAYHYCLALLGAVFYGFPSRSIFVVGVTGTKGKTTTIELIAAMLETAGHRAAVISSLRTKIGDWVHLNRSGTTMPGRFYIQRHLRKAVKAGCRYAIVEVTSEGIMQHRHRFIDFDTAIMINLSPEHIESHGSFERYRAAKLELFRALEQSSKPKRTAILNGADEHYEFFRERVHPDELVVFHHSSIKNFDDSDKGMQFSYEERQVETVLAGWFNVDNILAAATFARTQGVGPDDVVKALREFPGIPGRFEFIQTEPFVAVVDYAHTPTSLEAVYSSLKRLQDAGKLSLTTNFHEPGARFICVLGATGGGRDQWKIPEMGKIASNYCDELVLTSEDPYDDDPYELIQKIRSGINPHVSGTMDVFELVDRRRAIEVAVEHARAGDLLIVTGKGSEPWMNLENGRRIPWDDRAIVRDAIKNKPATLPREKTV